MDGTGVKIKTYRIGAKGARGRTITLPQVWLDDIGAAPGDKVDVFRTPDDRLILELAPKPVGAPL